MAAVRPDRARCASPRITSRTCFRRIEAFNDEAPETHGGVLDAHAEINKLFNRAVYSAADKARMLKLMASLGVLRADEGEFVWLSKIRGRDLRA